MERLEKRSVSVKRGAPFSVYMLKTENLNSIKQAYLLPILKMNLAVQLPPLFILKFLGL